MTTSEIVRVGMPLDEFIEQTNQHMFELINGERRYKVATVGGHNWLIQVLYRLLLTYFAAKHQGEVLMEATFILPDAYDAKWVTGSRTPDLLVYTGTRFADYQAATPDWRDKPYLLIPDLVIEVVSPNDIYSELDEKIDAYLVDGVRLIWVIDPQRRKAVVYAPDKEQPYHLRGDGVLDGEDILPDLKIELSRLFG